MLGPEVQGQPRPLRTGQPWLLRKEGQVTAHDDASSFARFCGETGALPDDLTDAETFMHDEEDLWGYDIEPFEDEYPEVDAW